LVINVLLVVRLVRVNKFTAVYLCSSLNVLWAYTVKLELAYMITWWDLK